MTFLYDKLYLKKIDFVSGISFDICQVSLTHKK